MSSTSSGRSRREPRARRLNTPGRHYRTWDEQEAAGELEGVVWEYMAHETACPVGRALNGRRFATLAELYEHLPGFNENPACTRRPCACTAMPTRLAEHVPMRGYLIPGTDEVAG